MTDSSAHSGSAPKFPSGRFSQSAGQKTPCNKHGQDTRETFPKGRNPDPLGTHVSHNRLNTSTIQSHPVPEGQTKLPFGDTRRDTPHTLGYTTATNSLSTPQDTPLKPNLGTGPLSIFSTKILRIQSFTLYLHPLSKSAQQKLKKIWVWSGSSAG